LGDAAARDLWKQLVQQHQAYVASTENRHHPQQQQQQQQQQQRQQQQEGTGKAQQSVSQPGASKQGLLTELRQHKQQVQLGHNTMEALLQGWLAARSDLAKQRAEGWMRCLRQSAKGSGWQYAASTAPSADQQQQQVAAGAAAGGAVVDTDTHRQWVPPSVISAAAAADPMKWQALQELLQQLPPAAHQYGLATALGAAATKGHEGVCVRLLQQLAAAHPEEAVSVVHEVVGEVEGSCYVCVRQLGPSSLELCGALLCAWQEVREQQQQELVDAVVCAVETLQGDQQQAL
jgi:hypothetical protein